MSGRAADYPSSVPNTVALTIGAGVVTDQYRQLGAKGDGLAFPGGYAVYPASNAAVLDATLNGNFETNITGWTNNAAGGVASRITTDSKFGLACMQTVNNGAGANQGPITSLETSLVAANVYTYHLWAKSVSGATTVRMQINWIQVDGVTAISSSTSDITLTTAWQHFILTATAPALGVDAKLLLINTAATAATYNIDGVQFDNGPIALPFDTANTRIAGRVQMPWRGLFTTTQGWVAVLTKMGYASTQALTANEKGLFDLRDDENNRISLMLGEVASAHNPRVTRRAAASNATASGANVAFTAGQNVLWIGAWSATSLDVSGAGSAYTSQADTNIPTIAAQLADIGEDSVNQTDRQMCNSALWFACGSGPKPTAADVVALLALPAFLPDPYAQVADAVNIAAKVTGAMDCRSGVMEVLI